MNPKNQKPIDYRIGVQKLSKDVNDEGVEGWYVDHSYLLNLHTSELVIETYDEPNDKYNTETKKLTFPPAKMDDVIMIEMRGTACSLWIDNKSVQKDVFNSQNLTGTNVHVVVDFEKNDGETVHYFGFDELPLSAPVYTPPTTVP